MTMIIDNRDSSPSENVISSYLEHTWGTTQFYIVD